LISEALFPVSEVTLQDEKLKPGWRLQRDLGAGFPALQHDRFVAIPIERDDLDSSTQGIRTVGEFSRVNAKLPAICSVELPQLYENGAPRL